MTKSFLLGALTALAASPLLLLALPESRPGPSSGAGTGCEGAPLESLMNRLVDFPPFPTGTMWSNWSRRVEPQTPPSAVGQAHRPPSRIQASRWTAAGM